MVSDGHHTSLSADRIREELLELCCLHGEDFIVTGGWSVLASLEVAGALRDFYEVTKNGRVKKAQFVSRSGFNMDLYVDGHYGLRVPFGRAQAYSRIFGDSACRAPSTYSC